MTEPPRNSAIQALAACVSPEFVLGQVMIRRRDSEFELCHVADVSRREGLQEVAIPDLCSLAQFTERGGFRPLHSAPNLRVGWRLRVNGEPELEQALNILYPNAVTDWHLVATGTAPVTHYREFTARQTGMYRITTMLSDAQAARAIRACCDVKFCLKRRLWSVPGLAPDAAEAKSAIPCLEPCALLLEFARKAMRIEQEEQRAVSVSAGDGATLLRAVEACLAAPQPEIREADFSHPLNPRRLQLAAEKLGDAGIALDNQPEED